MKNIFLIPPTTITHSKETSFNTLVFWFFFCFHIYLFYFLPNQNYICVSSFLFSYPYALKIFLPLGSNKSCIIEINILSSLGPPAHSSSELSAHNKLESTAQKTASFQASPNRWKRTSNVSRVDTQSLLKSVLFHQGTVRQPKIFENTTCKGSWH